MVLLHKDLNATMFYKAKFNIATVGEEQDLLWKVVRHVKECQAAKWNGDSEIIPYDCGLWTKLKYGGRIFSNDERKSVYIESEYFQPDDTEEQYWACRIAERRPQSSGVAPRQWVTEIGFEQKAEGAAILSIVTTYSDQPKFIGPCEGTPAATLPCIVRNILNDRSLECTVGMDTPIATPTPLYSGDWPRFWKRLTHKDRKLPYIYISAYHTSDSAGFLISPELLANAVCGNALVFYPYSPEFTEEMNRFCPENYACFRGAVAVKNETITQHMLENGLTTRPIEGFHEYSAFYLLHNKSKPLSVRETQYIKFLKEQLLLRFSALPHA